eukprot:tig00000821_g4467.t1
MERRVLVGLLALVALQLALASNPMQFDVPVHSFKCLHEEIPANTFVFGEYFTQPGPGMEIEVSVTDPSNGIKHRRDKADEGRFTFETSYAGDHKFCFYNKAAHNQHPSGSARIGVIFKTGLAAKDYAEIARKENLKPLEVHLRRMEDVVNEIQREMEYMKEREAYLRDTNESTNARVAWFSVFSICVLIGLGVYQSFYMRKFFMAKKLI